ncbi:unnamed protein product [Rangifer tarandus platyrhynchus]|uniref:Uncharacterized protein n=1 Tax=Rangifer tarandus platyrhynchus TaxID=3082113 RepID=A0ABN8XP82_RANTA|nr:unnamed protein product [Rangifer tarandus platyrhynchus]
MCLSTLVCWPRCESREMHRCSPSYGARTGVVSCTYGAHSCAQSPAMAAAGRRGQKPPRVRQVTAERAFLWRRSAEKSPSRIRSHGCGSYKTYAVYATTERVFLKAFSSQRELRPDPFNRDIAHARRPAAARGLLLSAASTSDSIGASARIGTVRLPSLAETSLFLFLHIGAAARIGNVPLPSLVDNLVRADITPTWHRSPPPQPQGLQYWYYQTPPALLPCPAAVAMQYSSA